MGGVLAKEAPGKLLATIFFGRPGNSLTIYLCMSGKFVYLRSVFRKSVLLYIYVYLSMAGKLLATFSPLGRLRSHAPAYYPTVRTF